MVMDDNKDSFPWHHLVLGIAGGIVGGVLGAFVYGWGIGQGFDAAVLPGAAVGFGFVTAARMGRVEFGVVASVIALIASLYLEWSHFPFVADDSLGFFLAHLHELQPLKLIMIAAGTIIAFSIAGRARA